MGTGGSATRCREEITAASLDQLTEFFVGLPGEARKKLSTALKVRSASASGPTKTVEAVFF